MAMMNNQAQFVQTKDATLFFNLDLLRIAIETTNPSLANHLQLILDHPNVFVTDASPTADITVQLKLVDSLPDPPQLEPLFSGDNINPPDGVGCLVVYPQAGGYLFYFQNGGLVQINTTPGTHYQIQAEVNARLVTYGRLYDLLFTTLSYFLRRKNYYLIHASAVVRNEVATLFAGAGGSGKSTTALNLTLNGWKALSNDTLLLQERPNGIYALPTPGGFSIRPQSLHHLPALTSYGPFDSTEFFYNIPLSRLGLDWAQAAPVKTIYFPEIATSRENRIQETSQALTLARLIELSLDRWDVASLPDHITFLEKLSRQAGAATLTIRDQTQLLELLNKTVP